MTILCTFLKKVKALIKKIKETIINEINILFDLDEEE